MRPWIAWTLVLAPQGAPAIPIDGRFHWLSSSDFPDSRGCTRTLVVRALDRNGAPIEGASVGVRNAWSTPPRRDRASGATDAEGRCELSLPGAESNVEIVEVDAGRLGRLHALAKWNGVERRSLDPFTFDRAPASIAGRVIDDLGNPIVGAAIHVAPDGFQSFTEAVSFAAATTGRDGRFAIGAIVPGPALLGAAADGFADEERFVRLNVGERRVETFRLAQGPARALTVLDESGAPLAGIRVTVGSRAFWRLRAGLTDASGRFRIAGIPAGDSVHAETDVDRFDGWNDAIVETESEAILRRPRELRVRLDSKPGMRARAIVAVAVRDASPEARCGVEEGGRWRTFSWKDPAVRQASAQEWRVEWAASRQAAPGSERPGRVVVYADDGGSYAATAPPPNVVSRRAWGVVSAAAVAGRRIEGRVAPALGPSDEAVVEIWRLDPETRLFGIRRERADETGAFRFEDVAAGGRLTILRRDATGRVIENAHIESAERGDSFEVHLRAR